MTELMSRSALRAEAILVAVAELIHECGYERVTVDAIAERAHASKATIYRRWPTKAALTVAAVRRHARTVGEADTLPDTGSLRGDLMAALASMSRVITGPGGVSLLSLVEAVRDDPVLRSLIRDQVTEGSRTAAETISERASARGELTTTGATGLAPFLQTTFAALLLDALLGGGPQPENRRRQLVDDVLLPLITRSTAPASPSGAATKTH